MKVRSCGWRYFRISSVVCCLAQQHGIYTPGNFVLYTPEDMSTNISSAWALVHSLHRWYFEDNRFPQQLKTNLVPPFVNDCYIQSIIIMCIPANFIITVPFITCNWLTNMYITRKVQFKKNSVYILGYALGSYTTDHAIHISVIKEMHFTQ